MAIDGDACSSLEGDATLNRWPFTLSLPTLSSLVSSSFTFSFLACIP